MWVRSILAICSVGLLVVGCDATAPRPNIILISIDTLRPDHLGCYGYRAETSPEIDQLALDGVVFEHTSAHAPSTLPSHASLLTSLLPQQHGASHALRRALPEAALTLAEVLTGEGYRSASFNGGGQLSSEYGLGQGFETYDKVGVRLEDRFALIAHKALEWLDVEAPRPFFLFLHSYEVHLPYTAEPRFYLPPRQEDSVDPMELLRRVKRGEIEVDGSVVAAVTAGYDAEIRSLDEGFGRFMADLKERGLYDETLIVVTSDHGEEFGEHGRVATHSHTLYEELLRVPWILKLPRGGFAGRRVEDAVRSIDIAPTLLSAVGIPIPEAFTGDDLMPVLRGTSKSAQVREVVAYRDTSTKNPRSSLSAGRWKLIGRRLYDLDADPQEQTNVAAENRRELRATRQRLQEILQEARPLTSQSAELDSDTLEQLEALGYTN